MTDNVLPPEATMALAGAAGSLVYCFLRPDRENWARSLASISSGAFASFYLSPAICEWRAWQSIHLRHAAAFVIGLIGIIACKALIAGAGSELTTSAAGWLFAAIKRAAGLPTEPRSTDGTPTNPGPSKERP